MNANALLIKIKRLHPDAVIPQYAKPGDSGFDLVAVEDIIVRPGETVKVRTGLAFEIPSGYELQVQPRSGVTSKTKLRVAFGTVDSGYRGEVAVIVDNIESPVYTIENDGDTDYLYVPENSLHPLTLEGYPHKIDKLVSERSYIIRKGDRIAQGVIVPVMRATFSESAELSETERGADGFESSGVRAGEGVRCAGRR